MPAPVSPVAGAIRLAAGTVAFSALLFLSAGTVRWPAAWAYLAIITAVMVAYAVIVARLHPDLIEERLHPPADAKQWDKPFAAIVAVVGPIVLLLLCGLDHRLAWSGPAPGWAEVAGLLAVGGRRRVVASGRSPPTASSPALVRVQRDRGHRVVDTGPYRYRQAPGIRRVDDLHDRHDRSRWARASRSAPPPCSVVVLAVRTALEDRTLHEELDGYADYARRVRFRIVPGVW